MDVVEQVSGADVRKSTDAERQMTLMAPAQYVNNFFVTVVAPGVRLTLTETFSGENMGMVRAAFLLGDSEVDALIKTLQWGKEQRAQAIAAAGGMPAAPNGKPN